jgi:glycine cleavage system aminomethyltransferase T
MKADLTIVRMGENQFRIITGVTDGPRDKIWFTQHLQEDGSVQLIDQTTEICTIGVWGPRARDIIQSLTDADMSHQAFKFGWARDINLGDIKVWVFRISYVGDLGWEIYIPMKYGQTVWDLIAEAGKLHGIVPAGIGVYGTTGRLEKGYRLFGAELDGEYTPIEAGLLRPKVKSQDFIGKDALVKLREKDPVTSMCTLTVDNHLSSNGELRYMLGGEPILTLDGDRIVDTHGRSSYVTSAGSGPSTCKHILMAYLPPQYAKAGTSLLVEYFDSQHPITVAVAGNGSLFDPDNERIRS